MAQPWYQKASVQAAIVIGCFTLIVPIIQGIFNHVLPSIDEDHKDKIVDTKLDNDVYRIRVTVLDLEDRLIENTTLRSSLGGEKKKVDNGWQIDIPKANVPKHRKLKIYATKSGMNLHGKAELELSNDYNPTAIIKLKQDSVKFIEGIVKNDKGEPIDSVVVNAEDYYNAIDTTASDGHFSVSVSTLFGESVFIRATKEDEYESTKIWHPAGSKVNITLARKNNGE